MNIGNLARFAASVILMTACGGGGGTGPGNGTTGEAPALPDDKIYGVVNVSVGDARMQPRYSAEMGTQQLLGSPVRLVAHDDWWQVETPEGYLAWMTAGSLVRMTRQQFNAWTAAPKIVFTEQYGSSYERPDENGPRVSDLVFGCILRLEGDAGRFHRVSYPDGRTAHLLKSQTLPWDEWLASTTLTGESIVQKALTLKGIPYTWGGTSTKAVDCSGFSKTVMLMHGVILRRDASQQALTGTPVDISGGYGNLQAGDLMFFGTAATAEKPERIRHVAIYMGGGQFIHAAGMVKTGSLDPGSEIYDELNTREFVRASRVVGAVGTPGIWRVEDNPLYNRQ